MKNECSFFTAPSSLLCFELFSGEELVCLVILFDGLIDDFHRQAVVAVRICGEPVTDELLVIGRLRLAGFIALAILDLGLFLFDRYVTRDRIFSSAIQ